MALRNCCNQDPFFMPYTQNDTNSIAGWQVICVTPEHGSIEVGHINYSPLLQNTVEGTETMYLMMHNAFDQLEIGVTNGNVTI